MGILWTCPNVENILKSHRQCVQSVTLVSMSCHPCRPPYINHGENLLKYYFSYFLNSGSDFHKLCMCTWEKTVQPKVFLHLKFGNSCDCMDKFQICLMSCSLSSNLIRHMKGVTTKSNDNESGMIQYSPYD